MAVGGKLVQTHFDTTIGTLRPDEWKAFLRLAADEGWRVTDRETELFCGPFADHAFVIRSSEGPCAFVTAVCHERNGWIGNLLVAAGCRGQGYGGALLDCALHSLRERGARCIWLTASELGRPLYERRGFFFVDGVDRWVRDGEGAGQPSDLSAIDADAVIAADARAWGGSRAGLLTHLVAEGETYSGGESLALLQVPGPMRVLGPWVKQTGDDDVVAILSAAVAMTAAGVEIMADVRRSAGLDACLEQAGFRCQGYNALMAQGAANHVDLSRVLSLASLGSMG